IKAVDDVSLYLRPGQTIGLVGESGCGKTTLARTIVGLYLPTAGEILFEGKSALNFSSLEKKFFAQKVQIIFQDPFSSLNPRMKIISILSEGLKIHKLALTKNQIYKRCAELLNLVGLSEEYLERYPHEFSGGQRQRIAIARALSVQPEYIICDEPVSSLDVSVQAQIINLLLDLQEKFNLGYLFISHDLSVVKYISQKIAVMYQGKIVEYSDSEKLFEKPEHPYTQLLLSSIPEMKRAIPNQGKEASTSYA
ncbi:MAG: ATP-binding cassette domain-containing protein, partial [Endomicrobiia bacterium]